jgi:APA family basic amino acid/polyamine antiporter
MTTTPVPDSRKVGLWIATALVVGNMIGSGVFLLLAGVPFYWWQSHKREDGA